MDIDFSIFPVLETARLNLRRLSFSDAQAIYELRSNPEVARLTGKDPFRSKEEAVAYIEKIEKLINDNACIFWAISYKEQSALIGAVCFWNFDNNSIEVGYELLPEYQKKGIMREALAVAINYGFEDMGAGTITAFPSTYNAASVGVLEKLGFKLVPDTFKHTHENVEGMLMYILINS